MKPWITSSSIIESDRNCMFQDRIKKLPFSRSISAKITPFQAKLKKHEKGPIMGFSREGAGDSDFTPLLVLFYRARQSSFFIFITSSYVRAPGEEKKLSALFNIYGILGTGQAVIFCKTKKTAKQVAVTMNAQGFAVALLSSDLGVEERANCIRRFQQGLERVLISTNVTSRGIDVEQVTMVVNFDLPDHRNEETGRLEADCETYLHRIGRTGRFGKQGIAINMISDDRDRDTMKTIEAHFKIQIEPLDPHDIDDMERKLDQD